MSDASAKPKKSLSSSVAPVVAILKRYVALWFILLLAVVYGFVLLNIQMAVTAEPSQESIDAEVKSTAAPRIDPKVVDQMQSLQDHSVNVQTLFDQARSNPFQE